MSDTIFALSSGRPPAAIGVVRVSGRQALDAARSLGGTLLGPRRAGLRTLRDGQGRALDRGLVLVFPGPDSATGEDLVELHLHGGRAVVAAVEGALEAFGLRRAEPGEFTRRALGNGRIDLMEAEGLADLLAAETEAQRVAALGAAEGSVSRMVRGWSGRLMGLSAQVEAALDFDDEGDVSVDLAGMAAGAAGLREEMAAVLDQPPVERLRDGVRVVLAGPPNAGKSTLLNLMVGREAAIVSPVAGTTRDVVEAAVVREGAAYLLSDTAGLVEGTADPIEAIGVERARATAQAADIVLWLGDERPERAVLWVWARMDEVGRETPPRDADVAVSRKRPESVEALWRVVAERARELLPAADRPALNARAREHVRDAVAALGTASRDPLVLAEELRAARAALARVTGEDATEAMLDALFGRFCVGK